jgi:hypothetical protein
MAKWFSGRGSAAAGVATRCSGYVCTAIAGSVIAVSLVVLKPVSSNDAAPTAATSGVRRANWTIATGSDGIVADARREHA